jgi:phage FluMu protein Com
VRNILRRLGLPMACVAMFSLLGGHWVIFQSIAWAQMLREYSRNATVAEAVEKTFSGEAPCPMCKTIAKEKQKEEKAPATVKVEKKGEIFLFASDDLLPARPEWDFCYTPDNAFQVPVRFDSPPRPVPRVSILPSV